MCTHPGKLELDLLVGLREDQCGWNSELGGCGMRWCWKVTSDQIC